MAGNFVDSLVIGIGLDTSQIAEGVQKVGAQLDSGLSAAAQSAASKMSPLGEALKNLATQAESMAKPAEESLQAMHQLGLKAASEYQEQIDRIKAGLAQIQNDPALSDSDKASAMDAAMSQIDALKAKMEGLKEPADAALEAIHNLGLRTAEEIHAALEKAKADYEAIRASAALTDRDKAAGLAQTKAKIEQLEMELKRGLPQAAAQGFAGAEAAANKFRGALSSIWAQVSGPLMGAFAIGGTISSYISNAMSAGELADKLKVDIEEIQIWSGAMDRAGGSAAALQGTIEKLNASGKAQGDAIGVLLDLADKAGTMSKEAFVQKAKELEIDEKTIEVLAQGRKALDEHLKRQRDLGVYTKEDAEQSKKFKQSLADLLQAWDGFTSFIGRFTVPIMRVLADVLTAVVVFMRQHTSFVVAAITMIGAALAVRLLPPLRTLPGLIANVGKAFLRWLPFVAIITAIALLVEDFWVYLQGGESELAEFWAIFGTGPEIMAKLNAAWKETKGYLAAIGTGLAQMVRYWYDLMQASGMFAALGQTFKGLLQILKGLFTLDWNTLGEGISNVLNGLVKGVASAFKGVGILVKDAVQAIFKALWDNLPGFSSWALGVAETLKGIFRLDPSMIWNGLKNVFDGVGSMIATGLKGWLTLCANAWSAIIEVFTGQKIDLAAWVDEAWQKAVNVFNDAKNFVTQWISSLFGDGEAPDFGAIAQKIWTSITETFGKIKEWVGNWFKNLFGGIEIPSIGDLLGGAGDLAKGAAGAAAGLAKGAGDLLGKGVDLGKDVLGKAGDLLGGLLGDAKDGASKLGAQLGPMLKDGLAQAQETLGKGFDIFKGLLGDAKDGAAQIGEKLGPALKDGWKLACEGAAEVGTLFSDLLGNASDGARKCADILGPALAQGVELAKAGLGKGADVLGGILGSAADGAVKAGETLGAALQDGWEYAKIALSGGADVLGDLLGSAEEGAQKAADILGSALQGGIDIAMQGIEAAGDLFSRLFADAQPATEEAGAKIQAGMSQTAGAVRDSFNAAWQATAGYGVQAFQGAAATIQQIFAGIVSGIETQVGALVAGAQRMAGEAGMVPAFAGVRAQNAGTRNISQTNNNRITIHAPGGDPRAVQQGVQRGLSQSNKTFPAQSGTVPKG